MSNVKIKKSVLQSIIKRSLSESGLHSDPSRRLTVGPDVSALPAPLPLSPGNRMSTQLETERPPVEDPEYVPANRKELGLALQALAEIVPVDGVEKAYHEFQRTVEQLEKERDEGDESEENDDVDFEEDLSVESQLESINRKLRKIDSLLSEAPPQRLRGFGGSDKFNDDPEALAALERMKDYKPDVVEREPANRKEQMQAFGRWLAKEKKRLGSSDEQRKRQFIEFLKSTNPEFNLDAIARQLRGVDADDMPGDEDVDVPMRKPIGLSLYTRLAQNYSNAIAAFGLGIKSRKMNGNALRMLVNLVDGGSITESELIKFFESIPTFAGDQEFSRKVKTEIARGAEDPEALAAFIKKFSDENESPVAQAGEKDFSLRDQYKRFGYSAESGLRQAIIRDVEGPFLLRDKIFPEIDEDEIEGTLSDAFVSAITSSTNAPLLSAIFTDPDDVRDYVEWVKENRDNLAESDIYRNFRGAVNYNIMSAVADMHFLGPDKKINKDRTIGLAFMKGWTGYAPPNESEKRQLEQMATSGVYSDLLDEFLDEARSSNFKNIMTAAILLTVQDMDRDELGGYHEAAFTSLRKHSGNRKVPEYALKDYIDDETPEGKALLDRIKAANKESDKLAKAATGRK